MLVLGDKALAYGLNESLLVRLHGRYQKNFKGTKNNPYTG